MVAAYAAGIWGIDFCGPAHYGPLVVGISLLAFLLLLVEAEYLLRCHAGDRDLMTLPVVFWGALLVPLLLALVDVTGFWTVLVLPWYPLETLAPGRTLLHILAAVSAVDFCGSTWPGGNV